MTIKKPTSPSSAVTPFATIVAASMSPMNQGGRARSSRSELDEVIRRAQAAEASGAETPGITILAPPRTLYNKSLPAPKP
ncbi:MAG: hypothetical protein DHS20C10_08530 [marine bacterium B5-7]|nr:MAG: hypothetical protein DHS20C10_08530 [marine bacterium B5-7]